MPKLTRTRIPFVAGFEAGGQYTPSSIEPWRPIGSEPDCWLETQKASVFEGNPIALKFEARGTEDENGQLKQDLGFSNPGYWGMVGDLTLISGSVLVTRVVFFEFDRGFEVQSD